MIQISFVDYLMSSIRTSTPDQDEKFLTKGFASALFEERVDLSCVTTYYETKHL